MAEPPAPNEPKRRAQPNLHGSLGARRGRPVERPLQVRPVDVDRLPAAVLEIDGGADGRIAAGRYGDLVPPPRRRDRRDAVAIGASAPAPELHTRAPHTHTLVAVEDRD